MLYKREKSGNHPYQWKLRWLVSVSLLFLASANLAQSNQSELFAYPTASLWYPVLSLGAGTATASNVGRSQTFPIIDPVTDEFYIYTADRPTQTAGAIDGFIGTEWRFHPNWALQMGLGYDQAWSFRAKGSLLQGADTQSADQYSYSYDILTRQLLAETKLLYQVKEKYHPYVLLGLGVASNETSNYGTNASPLLTFTRQYPNNNTQTSFTYSVGAGIDIDLQKHLRCGIGYRFADFGQVQLGNATINTTRVSGTLSQTHLYANEILAQLTFVG